MIEYDSASIYVDSATDLRTKITRIKSVIAALETTALTAAEKGAVSEYSLDDGQVKIKTTYRNPKEVSDSINAFEAILQRYVNQLNGRHIRLVDSKNFLRKRDGR